MQWCNLAVVRAVVRAASERGDVQLWVLQVDGDDVYREGPRAVFTVVVRQEEFGVATDVGVTKVAAKVVGATMHAMVMASRIRILGIEKA